MANKKRKEGKPGGPRRGDGKARKTDNDTVVATKHDPHDDRKVIGIDGDSEKAGHSDAETVVARKPNSKDDRKVIAIDRDTGGSSDPDGGTVIATKPGKSDDRLIDPDDPVGTARKVLEEIDYVPLVDRPEFKKWFDEHRKFKRVILGREITISLEGIILKIVVRHKKRKLAEFKEIIGKDLDVSGPYLTVPSKGIKIKLYLKDAIWVVESDAGKIEWKNFEIDQGVTQWGYLKSIDLLRYDERGIEGLLELMDIILEALEDFIDLLQDLKDRLER